MNSDESLNEPFSASESEYEPDQADYSSSGKKPTIFLDYKRNIT